MADEKDGGHGPSVDGGGHPAAYGREGFGVLDLSTPTVRLRPTPPPVVEDDGVIVDSAVYRQGVRHPCDDFAGELAAIREAGEGFLWIGLKDPTDAEFAKVNLDLHLHPLAVEDALHGNQRAKIEHYENSVFVVLKTLRYDDPTSQVETGELMIFLGEDFIVTVRKGEMNPLADVRRRLEANPVRIALGPAAVLHAITDSVVDGYVAIDREVDQDLREIEDIVFRSAATADANIIYRLKREVLEFRRASQPLADALIAHLEADAPKLVPAALKVHFRDIADHLRLIGDHVDSYDRLLSELLSTHLAGVGVKQNEDMRRISAWVAMAAIPTMIAGIYGMNFEHMPELSASVSAGGHEIYYGYPLVVVVMAAICFVVWTRFKKSGWL